MHPKATVAQAIIKFLEANLVAHVFGVPGESYLAVLDALHDSAIQFVNARQEGGGAMMAEAYGKLTQQPGVCMVTRGPGATNASAGVHVAQQDSTPMLLFVGQISSDFVGRDAFQEVDYQQFFGGMAKAVIELARPERVIEQLSRAWSLAMSGRPGPVVLVLPEDILTQGTDVPKRFPQNRSAVGSLEDHQAHSFLSLLNQAERPIAIIGQSAASATTDNSVWLELADCLGMPMAASFRRQGELGCHHNAYAGDVGLGINPKLKARIDNADLVLLLNAPMSEVPSQGFTMDLSATDSRKIVQILTSPDELGRYFQPALGGVASLASLLALLKRQKFTPKSAWADQVGQARQDYEQWTALTMTHPGPVQMAQVVDVLRRQMPTDTIMTNGAGNYASWLHRFWYYKPGTQVAPTSGSMGYGLPAAIAASVLSPEKTVMCWAGDGCLQMTIQEMATVAELGLKVILLLIDNGIYGTIRMHQEREFPGRVSGTSIKNPNFCQIANGYGWASHLVEAPEQFEPALLSSLAHQGPSLIRVMLDADAITPTTTLGALRAKAGS